jgi:hypothetical protein
VIVALGPGNLLRWDTTTGHITSTPTGQGIVRRIHFAPPASEALDFNPVAGAGLTARIAVLFANGTFGIWELDTAHHLRTVRLGVASHLLFLRRCLPGILLGLETPQAWTTVDVSVG